MSAVLKSTLRSSDVPIDFREHIQNLRARDLLWEIDAPITIETEAHPLVRLQFRGLKEDQRRGFLLKNVRSADGRSFGGDLAIGCLAASRKIFETGLGMQPGDNLLELVSHALRNPLPPEVVTNAPCQEEVHMGASLTEHGGLGEFPIPISTPGYDNGPYTTFSHWVTKDPETGIYNIGNYRGQVKAPDRIGCFTYPPQHLGLHWVKCKRLGIPLEAALVIGVPPYVSYAANAKIPYEADELHVAGALSGRPLPVVQAKTVDLLVPAYAEIVIEGRISTTELEPEAPFGETHGFMSQPVMSYFMEVTAITHRKKPTWCSILSQFPPSESTRLRSISFEASFFKHLKYDCNLAGVIDVHFPQATSAYYTCFIKIKRNTKADPWQALYAAAGYDPFIKMFVVTDEDVDIRDPEMMLWATATRAMPHRDMRIIDGRMSAMDFSAIRAEEAEGFKYMEPNGSSAILINACRPWAYPPVALPRKDFMENAIQRWQELGLPALELKKPWHGYDLGFWSEQCETEAQMAVEGRHYEIGEAAKQRRVKATDQNTGGVT